VKGFKYTRRALLAASAAATLLVAACSNGGNEPQGPGPMPTDDVTLEFWWWGNDARAATTQKVIDAFESEYPYIHIDGQTQVFDNYFANLATRVAGNDMPDVITMGGAFVLQYAEDGNLLNLSEASDLHSNVFPESILKSATVDGEVYGVPTGANAIGVFINPAIFKAAGVAIPNDNNWTWDDFVDIANEISDKSPDGTYGAEIRSYDMIGAYAGQRTPLYDTEGNLTVTKETLTDFWEFEKALLDGGGLPPADLFQQVRDATVEQTLFARNRSAMFIGYTNQLGAYATAAGVPPESADAFQMLRIPSETQYSSPGTTFLPSQYYTVNVDTDYPRQAALFVDFLVNSTKAGELILADRGVPSSPAVREHVAPLLVGYQKVIADFMTRINDLTGPAFLPPAWGTVLNEHTKFADDGVIGGTLSPSQAADEWLSRMKAAHDAAP
jgi:multiple sugar transport system substrate-binding protein